MLDEVGFEKLVEQPEPIFPRHVMARTPDQLVDRQHLSRVSPSLAGMCPRRNVFRNGTATGGTRLSTKSTIALRRDGHGASILEGVRSFLALCIKSRPGNRIGGIAPRRLIGQALDRSHSKSTGSPIFSRTSEQSLIRQSFCANYATEHVSFNKNARCCCFH